jgi:hypothetical protein
MVHPLDRHPDAQAVRDELSATYTVLSQLAVLNGTAACHARH